MLRIGKNLLKGVRNEEQRDQVQSGIQFQVVLEALTAKGEGAEAQVARPKSNEARVILKGAKGKLNLIRGWKPALSGFVHGLY